MAKITDPWDHHDWAARDYVEQWADRQDSKEAHRQEAFKVLADSLPFEPKRKDHHLGYRRRLRRAD